MLTLVALLALLAPQAPAPKAQAPAQPPAVDWAELLQRFQADAAAIQKAGATLDLAALKIEKLGPGELVREVAKRDSDYYGTSWYEMLWVLAQAFGLKVDASPDAFQTSFQRVTTPELPAWYVPARKSILIEEAQYTRDSRFDRVMLHALALASFDQQPGGLGALRTGNSTDEMLCDRAWITGRAQLFARRALGVEPRGALTAYEERTGEFALVDFAGEAEVARQESLPEAGRLRPKSGTALLHGIACGVPAPAGLETLDPKDAKLAREDSLGELGLRFVLSMGGAHPVRAIESGIGLCADRLRLWKYGERDHEFVWRLVFASESDAAELEQLLTKLGRGTRTRRGCVVDWSFATRPEREAALATGLAALALPPAPPASVAEALARVQSARLALQPHMDGARWLLPELGLAWKLPEGARPSFYQADPIVFLGAPDEGFRDNLTFREYALPADATPEKVLEGARKSFEGLASVRLLRAELAETPAGRGVRVEFTQLSSGKEVHQLELQLVLPGRKQAVTATTLESHWKSAGAGIEALLAATERIAPPAPPEPKK